MHWSDLSFALSHRFADFSLRKRTIIVKIWSSEAYTMHTKKHTYDSHFGLIYGAYVVPGAITLCPRITSQRKIAPSADKGSPKNYGWNKKITSMG